MAKAFPLLTINPEGTVADNVGLILHIRLAEMLGFARHVADVTRVAELHNMRIAAKRLRYTMELVLPYVDGANGKALSGLLDKTKKMQELIGDIHDRDVRVPLIEEFLRQQGSKRPEVTIGLTRLADRERSERDRMYSEFVGIWLEQRERYVARLTTLIGIINTPGRRPEQNLEDRAEVGGSQEADKVA